MLIYKILLPAEWEAFRSAGRFEGSPFDHRSGFVHCSSREQVAGTAARFFAQEPALVVVALDADALGAALRFEPASDGTLFPHVYAAVPISAVVAVHHAAGAAHAADGLPPAGAADGPAG